MNRLRQIARRKPAAEITDRQRRRRARARLGSPHGQRCGLCGSSRNLRVNHLNGNEADESDKNLMWVCHADNIFLGFLLKRLHLGRPVDLEYKNPPAEGARTLPQWLMAVRSLRGESDEMTPRAAIQTIRATSPARRSGFAHEIWDLRRQRGTDKTGVPF